MAYDARYERFWGLWSIVLIGYRNTLLIRNTPLLGPYNRDYT